MPVDDSYTKALLHMDGADGSTTFTDESGKTWTARGNAQIDTAQSKFSGASGLFDGASDIYTADHADFNLSNVNWTFDSWVRFNSISGSPTFFSQYEDANNWFDCWWASASNQIGVAQLSAGGYANGFSATAPFSPSANTWYHIMIARNGNSLLVATNGTLQTVTETQTISGKTLSNLTGAFVVGSWNASLYLNGWLDEFRFSNGIARWTTNFTPPTAPYGADDMSTKIGLINGIYQPLMISGG